MILPTQYQCDAVGCKSVRTYTNHWLAVKYAEGLTEIYEWDRAEADQVLDRCRHFCGSNHTLQYVSSAIGKTEGK